MGKPYGGWWGILTKCKAWLGYCVVLIVGPLLWGCPDRGGFFFEFFRTLVNQGQNQFYDFWELLDKWELDIESRANTKFDSQVQIKPKVKESTPGIS